MIRNWRISDTCIRGFRDEHLRFETWCVLSLFFLRQLYESIRNQPVKNWWLENYFGFALVTFQGRCSVLGGQQLLSPLIVQFLKISMLDEFSSKSVMFWLSCCVSLLCFVCLFDCLFVCSFVRLFFFSDFKQFWWYNKQSLGDTVGHYIALCVQSTLEIWLNMKRRVCFSSVDSTVNVLNICYLQNPRLDKNEMVVGDLRRSGFK